MNVAEESVRKLPQLCRLKPLWLGNGGGGQRETTGDRRMRLNEGRTHYSYRILQEAVRVVTVIIMIDVRYSIE